MDHQETRTMRQRMLALLTSGALVLSTAGAPMAAFAAGPAASAGGQEPSGATEVTVQMLNDEGELSGTDDDNNKDGDDDDRYGDNIAFTVPASINFVANANGQLIGPSASATFLENESVFGIHATSLDVDAKSGWNIVADASASDKANAIDFQVGPRTSMLDAADYLDKATIDNSGGAWSMTSRKTGEGVVSDRVQMTTEGDVANIGQEVKGRVPVATMRWYVARD